MLKPAPSHRFVVEVAAIPDALARVLGPFAVQQVELASVRHDRTAAGARAILEAVDLDSVRADHLQLRLAQMPIVRWVEVWPIAERCDGERAATGSRTRAPCR